MKKKLPGALLALGMIGAGMTAPSAGAQAVTVPGCWGAVLVACEPTIDRTGGGVCWTFEEYGDQDYFAEWLQRNCVHP